MQAEEAESGSGMITMESSLSTAEGDDSELYTPCRPTMANPYLRARGKQRSTSTSAGAQNYHLQPAIFPSEMLFPARPKAEQRAMPTPNPFLATPNPQPMTSGRPAQPQPAAQTMLYQIVNVNKVAKVVPLFRGDYLNKEEPSDWFAEFQLSLLMTWTEAMKVDQFSRQLVAGSYAEEWFMDLLSRDKFCRL
ncbi:hypothetical protein EDC04DRAFT_2894455 [Pisolithus marmoratus]|nr:hypothetical protein EDC04DRAFT_2894455 [Pisolithus marmoratus]